MEQDTVVDVTIIEFEELFNWDWLNNKFRENQLFGGVDNNIHVLSTGGYAIPKVVSNQLEDYFDVAYQQIAGDLYIEDQQETYTTVIRNGKKLVAVWCQAMCSPRAD